jgi:hypothetical protein
MTTRHCIWCEWAGIDTPATADAPSFLCREHWAFFRECARKAEQQERAPVIVGGPLTSEPVLVLAGGQQLAAALVR